MAQLLMHRWSAIIALVTALASPAPVALAWEQDVHYVLTFWLATHAGFSRNNADVVATGNQSYDDSHHSGAIPTVILIGLTSDTGAAESVRDKHFPSDAPLPSPPARRVVSPNSPSARRAVLAEINEKETEPDLTRLGQALHPFQDSWSHQGVPSIPLGINPNLSFGHPDARGGWWRHDADYTHLHVADTIETAKETYALLVSFLQQHRSFATHDPTPWQALVDRVKAFAVAGSPAAKNSWAVSNLPVPLPSPPGDSQLAAIVPPPMLGWAPGPNGEPVAPPQELINTANQFLAIWFEAQDIGKAVSFFDMEELTKQFNHGPLRTPEAVAEWVQKVLTMELVADHSAVNAAGHGNPEDPRYRDLPLHPVSEGQFRTAPLVAPRLTPQNFLSLTPSHGLSPDFACLLTTEHSLSDEIALVWRQSNSRWKLSHLIIAAK